MAFSSADLSALSYANGFTLWHYKTLDAASDVDSTGYFNAAAAMLRAGDFLLVTAGPAGSPSHGIMVVTSNTGSVVDLANLTSMAAANTD